MAMTSGTGGETPPIIPQIDETELDTPLISTQFVAGTVSVAGGGNANVVVVDAVDGKLTVNGAEVKSANGTVATIAATRLIEVSGLAGDDILLIKDGTGSMPAAILAGGDGDDVLQGGSRDDSLYGGNGPVPLLGGRGADRLFGDAGNDRFIWKAGDGNDRIDGGADHDKLEVTGTAAGDSFAIVATATGARIATGLSKSSGIEVTALEHVSIGAGAGADSISVGNLAGSGVQEVAVNLGGNASDGMADRLSIDGTAGNDVVNLIESAGTLRVLGPTAVSVDKAGAEDQITLRLGDGKDHLTFGGSTAARLVIDGGNGDDIIGSGNGADVVIAGAGNDFVDGGKGDDLISLGDGDDIAKWRVGDGADTVSGGAGKDSLLLSGPGGSNTVAIGAGGSSAVTVDGTALQVSSVESLSFFSFGGKDSVTISDMSGLGVKRVDVSLFDFGIADQDTLRIEGTADDDTFKLTTENGALVIDGPQGKVVVTGHSAEDRIEIDGLGGNDTIDASALPANIRVTLIGGAGEDVILGGAGDDVLIGGDGNDVLFAGEGDNVALGGAGDDVLRGGLGDDVLDGGTGQDILLGGGGQNILLNGEVVFNLVQPQPDFLL
jgi:Ca2+-binding RTX toxin-like protein